MQLHPSNTHLLHTQPFYVQGYALLAMGTPDGYPSGMCGILARPLAPSLTAGNGYGDDNSDVGSTLPDSSTGNSTGGSTTQSGEVPSGAGQMPRAAATTFGAALVAAALLLAL